MKKGFTMIELIGVIVIMTLILLIAVPTINNVIKSSKEEKNQKSLKSIYMAAETYLLSNYEQYRSLDIVGNSDYIYVMDLINEQYIDINDINPVDNETFDNKDVVKVTRNEDNTFNYELISLKTLIEILLEKYKPGSTTGLLIDESNPSIYYYKGTNEEVNNNYLWYGGHQWRIIEFNTRDNTLILISQQPLTSIQPSSTAWKTEETYKKSYINLWLNDYFYNSLDDIIKNSIVNNTFNVGIYNDVDEIKTVQKIGLLDEEQYIKAGSTESYLDNKDAFWLGNRYNESNIQYINMYGNPSNYDTTNALGIRPVIKIADIIITGGNGTFDSNYETDDKATNTSNIQVGEYINVPYSGSDNACGTDNKCIFRVVSKDNDSIKVVLNGLLPKVSLYGSSSTITTSHTIYTPLNEFANNISNDYRYTGNKIFYIGDYPPSSVSYLDIQDETLLATVGVPTVGDIFSSNDIDLSMSNIKNFVNVETIENPTISEYYWVMNRYSSSYVRSVHSNAVLFSGYTYPTEGIGVRPVIFLKNNLSFVSGNGTADEPYELQ